jgi:hypothetical protein
MVAPRCTQTTTGSARLLGTNYRCGMQSRCDRASFVHRPRPAPTFVCHPVAWRNSRGGCHHRRHIEAMRLFGKMFGTHQCL